MNRASTAFKLWKFPRESGFNGLQAVEILHESGFNGLQAVEIPA
jgi:hypothetical protein